KDNPRDPADRSRTCKCAAQPKRSIAGKWKGEEQRDRVDRKWLQSESEKRKEQERESVAMLAEGERVLQRIKDVCVEEVQRIGKSLMVIPPQNPGDKVWISSVDHHVSQTR